MSEANANTNQNKREELGALWKRQGRSQTYLTGYVNYKGERLNLVVFSQQSKKSENQPDFRIYESLPLENKTQEKKKTSQPASVSADDGDLM